MPRMEKMRNEAKAKNVKQALVKFLRSIKKYRFQIIIAMTLSVAGAALSVFIPKILGDMTNIAINTYPNINFEDIKAKALLVVGLLFGSALLNYLQGYILAIVSAKYTKDLREKIIEKIAHLPISYFDTHKIGDTLSLMTNDIDILATSLSQEITDVTTNLTSLIGVLIIMFMLSAPLSLVAIIVVPLSVIVVGKITGFAQKFFFERQKMLGVLDGRVEEDYSGQSIIKTNSYEPQAIENFDKINQELTDVSIKAHVYASLSIPVTHIFTNLGYIAICILGGWLAIERGFSIGDLQAFVQYVLRFNRPITEIASTVATIQSLLASSERVFDFLGEPEEEPDPEPALVIDNVKGAVEFHDVCFSYNEGTPVIKNFSVKVEPGMKVAIVGPTGAGKTTIINLLMRFYEPNSGYITVDGAPIREMKRADVRKMFGMVLQDTWLFSGTVEENLRYGNQAATLDDIKKAAKASNVNHVIEALPKSYHSEISEDSDNISAGEKQLITIARAMLANPPMMILDEATSNVDTRTEQLIQDSFEKLTRNRTSFVIAHRLSTIRNSDLILVMKDGSVVEQGNHAQLLRKKGFYAELYNSQFAE
ncbi:ABC transporter ATP-binding protein [Candidatus Saccharibacteria bacterium]|nr:ABC transporter ATP-binding protein [Candidatus Saccharibacteria bacterium]